VGGLDRTFDLEDERLERRLRERGVPIVRSLAVRVTTSTRMRTDGVRGMAQDLAHHRPEDEAAGSGAHDHRPKDEPVTR
jgi:hypothetical protein